MDNAVALAQNRSLAAPIGFADRVKLMPGRAKASALLGIAALAGIVVALTMNVGQSDYKILYANLSDKDGGAVIAQLSTLNVPYKVALGGAIMVPALQVPDLRLKMATAGLPKGTVSGFELMDTARFGQTQFQERLTFQRGLEGELTRSITSLAAVENARVHLALPNQNGSSGSSRSRAPRCSSRCIRAARSTGRRSPASCTSCPRACPSSIRRPSACSTRAARC